MHARRRRSSGSIGPVSCLRPRASPASARTRPAPLLHRHGGSCSGSCGRPAGVRESRLSPGRTARPFDKEAVMAGKSESLAKAFETKAAEATKVIEGISDADWKKVTTAEKWPVGVVAHHIATGHQGIGGIVKSVADGKAAAPATF